MVLNKEEFIQQYVIQYVALKMSRVNRYEVVNGDIVERNTLIAMSEAEEIYNKLYSLKIGS
jgi:hypothetical protein